MPHLKGLRTLSLEVYGEAAGLDKAIRNHNFDQHRFFTIDFLPSVHLSPSSTRIKVSTAFLFDHHLCSVNRSVVADENLALAIQYSSRNRILYRATPAECGSESWYGLNLQTETASTFDYERLLDRYQRLLAVEENGGTEQRH